LSICAPDDNTDAEVSRSICFQHSFSQLTETGPLQVTQADFDSHRVTFRSFVEDPSIVDDPNLVIKYGNRYVRFLFACYAHHF
jgi:hypothetical protein